MTKSDMVGTIRTYADLCPRGSQWYRTAGREIREYCSVMDYNADRLADLLALFSPRVGVDFSVELATHYNSTGHFARGTMGCVRAAVEHWEETGVIRGPKTSAFARALKGDENAVVLDVWMARIIQVDQRDLKGERYEKYADVVRIAAELHGIAPAEIQAAAWCGIVREYGKRPGMIRLCDRIPALFVNNNN